MPQFHIVRVGENRNVPPEEEDVESALMVSNEDGRFGVEMLFTLHDKFDIEQLACQGIKRPCHDPINVEPVARQGHSCSDDYAPY